MADYYPVLQRAIGALDPNTADTRRGVYDRARSALMNQLTSFDPPLDEAEITSHRLALEDVIRRIEAEMRPRARASTPAAETPRLSPAVVGPPRAAASPPAAGTNVAATVAASDKVGPSDKARESGAKRLDAFGNEISATSEPDGSDPAASPVVEERRSRLPAIAAGLVVVLLGGLGAAAYLERDELSAFFGSDASAPTRTASPAANQPQPKILDRIGGGNDTAPASPSSSASGSSQIAQTPPPEVAPPVVSPPPAAPAPDVLASAPNVTPAPPAAGNAAVVAQRAILYEEAPDRQGGGAFSGTTIWQIEPGSQPADNRIRATVAIPERNVKLTMTIRPNTDATLPASHTIELHFDLPQDFSNVGVANVPGILFKPSEESGGAALAGLSVKVMTGFFLIGLSNAPAERAQNLQSMRENGWIDLPVLYENGRRAVITLEKGTPGERVFQEAMAKWDNVASNAPSSPPADSGARNSP